MTGERHVRNPTRLAGFNVAIVSLVSLVASLIWPGLSAMLIRCTVLMRCASLAILAVAPLSGRVAAQSTAMPAAAPQSPSAAETPADSNWGELTLFNGRDFDGLHIFVQDAAMKAADVVRVEDGAIRVSGVGKGYIRTTAAYADFKLSLEWRWPKGGGNSGVLLHMVNPDVIWPKGFEVQLATGRAGDLSSYADARSKEELVSRNPTGFSTGRLARKGPADVDASVTEKTAIEKPGIEKALNEWNRLEVLALGDELTVWINGALVNRMTGVIPSAGMIGLQAEGTAIDFRNVTLTPLPPRKDLHAPMPKP
jgi:hypothetical protein